jgi:hypothetical protein
MERRQTKKCMVQLRLFICTSFKDAVSKSDCGVPNVWMIVHVQHFPGGTGKNHDKISEHLVSRTIIEPDTSRIEDRSVITCAKLFI